MRHPWSKFYWSDWRSDPRLRMCGLAARGLWMEMLALMHESEPHGHLLVNGNAPTDDQLAVLAGAPPSQIPELLGELERVGVFSRTRNRVIYSRRMLRDEKKAATAREIGKKGGNPSLGKQRAIPPSDNPPDNPEDKPQKPDTRSQKPKEESQRAMRAEHDDWYSGYPKKEDPERSFRAYCKARKRASAEELVAGRDRYALECKDKERQYIKQPATWLNAGSWQNETPAERTIAAALDGGLLPQRSRPWKVIVDGFRRTGFWPDGMGPRPGRDGCEAPDELLTTDEIAAKRKAA